LALTIEKTKIFELGFAAVFSVVVFCVFYSLISMNGLVLGNDPAVHLEKAQLFLQSGKVPLTSVGWTPPLYQILLASFISFTGATSVNQLIYLVKIVAVVINWLLFFSVYLLGSKFFGFKIGVIAAVFLLMVFPIYELNLWGGYTTVLALALMFLLINYMLLSTKGFRYITVVFLLASSMVLSHQLAVFLSLLILPPVMLYMLVKSPGRNLKVLLALLLGGGIVFFVYYIPPIVSHLDVLVGHLFFEQKTMLNQIPATTFGAFMVDFGFILFLAFAGFFFAFDLLRAKRNLVLYSVLLLTFWIPLFLSQSHFFGLLLPFHWFIYYMLPAVAILAAVSMSAIIEKLSTFCRMTNAKKRLRKPLTFLAVLLLSLLFLFRFGVVYGKILEASVFYSTSDLKGYEAGIWLRDTFPGPANVVTTEVPGSWFGVFSGKSVIAQTDPTIDRILIAESVLHLSYELENPVTSARAYESKGDISGEFYVPIDGVWTRVSYSSAEGDFLSFTEEGIHHSFALSSLEREIIFENETSKTIVTRYICDEILLTKSVQLHNGNYSVTIGWTLSPLKSGITEASLYLSSFFDLHFNFDKAYIPGSLEWDNPWSKPSTVSGSDWATVNFSKFTLTEKSLCFYDETEKVTYALNFEKAPDWGNVGALASKQIDAYRFQYDFTQLEINKPASFSYQVLVFSESSLPIFQETDDINRLFEFVPSTQFAVAGQDYRDYIRENDIKFIVYDRNQLDTKMVQCKLLELVYANDRYVIFKIRSL